MFLMGIQIPRVNDNIIQVNKNKMTHHVFQHLIDKIQEDSWGIGEPKRHHKVLVVPSGGVESHLPHITLSDAYQMISIAVA